MADSLCELLHAIADADDPKAELRAGLRAALQKGDGAVKCALARALVALDPLMAIGLLSEALAVETQRFVKARFVSSIEAAAASILDEKQPV